MCEHGMETFMKNIQILFQLRKAIEVHLLFNSFYEQIFFPDLSHNFGF